MVNHTHSQNGEIFGDRTFLSGWAGVWFLALVNVISSPLEGIHNHVLLCPHFTFNRSLGYIIFSFSTIKKRSWNHRAPGQQFFDCLFRQFQTDGIHDKKLDTGHRKTFYTEQVTIYNKYLTAGNIYVTVIKYFENTRKMLKTHYLWRLLNAYISIFDSLNKINS